MDYKWRKITLPSPEQKQDVCRLLFAVCDFLTQFTVVRQITNSNALDDVVVFDDSLNADV